MFRGARSVARAELRLRWGALVVLTLTAILGLGATLSAFTAAYRTDHAYPEYVARADVADLVVNPSLLTTDVEHALRTLPHVRHVWSDGLLNADIDDGHPRTAAQFLAEPTNTGEVHGSHDGRYVDGDHLIVTAGHLPTGHREIFATEEYRADYKKRFGHEMTLGATVPLSFLWPMALEPDSGIPPDQRISPIGVEQVRIVGFGRLPDEVLHDDEFPRVRLVVSPDLDAKYDCVPKLPKDATAQAAVFSALFPQDCATEYRFYALDVDDPHNVPAVERAIADRAAAINKTLPPLLLQNTYIIRPIITTRASTDQRVAHAIRPIVIALNLFGTLAALATGAILALAIARIMRRTRLTNETTRALGMRRRERIFALSLPYVPVAVLSAAGAAIAAFAMSRLAPLGEARRVVDRASFSLPIAVAGPVVLGFLALFALTIVATAMSASRSGLGAGSRRRRSRSITPMDRVASPAVAEGIRSATGTGRGAILLLTASCVAIAALTASIVFGSSLVSLVDSPHRYGWPWDVGVLTNYGYGSLNQRLARHDLAARHDVASHDQVGFFSAQINGESIPVLIGGQDAPRVHLPIVHGREPTTFGEVALGADTASDLGAKIGDDLDVAFGAPPKQLRKRERLVGIAVFPSIGQTLADRTGLGRGLFTVVPRSQISSTQSGGDIDYTFVGITLKPDANPVTFAAMLRARAKPWDTSGADPFIYSAPIRPPEIRNAESIRNGPELLAALLGLALLIALGLGIAVSVNERKRDLAVLRALGFTRAQLRRSVLAQALTTVLVGIVIGLPLGILAGRWSWRVFADELGIGTGATLPALALAAMAVVVALGAIVAATRPAYVAARTHPADILHTQ